MSTNPPIREPLQRIATRLKEARARSGISREVAAERAGVPARTLRSWENGESTQPAWVIPVLASIYGVTSEWLLAPPGRFLALVDRDSERSLVTRGDNDSLAERLLSLSVIITEHLEPVASVAEWHRRMDAVWTHAEPKLRKRGDHEPT